VNGGSRRLKVRSLRADKVRVPFRRPFVTAQGMWLEREAWILQLTDADGRIGLGEAVLEREDGETAELVLDQLVREAVTAADTGTLPGPEALELHGAPGRAMRAALDAAVLDLAGRPARGTETGGAGVGVNATLPQVGAAASGEAALQAVEAGFRTLNLKAGAERETVVLAERIRAVRDAVGPEIRIRLDVNGSWDVETAVERLTGIRAFDVEYVEQPVAGSDPAGLAEVRRRSPVRVAADEAVTSLRTARELLEAGAADLLVVKLARVGGPVVARQVAELAAGAGVPVVLSTLFETGVGIAAALAAAAELPETRGARGTDRPDHGLATAGLLEHDLLTAELVVEHGRMWRPAVEPGEAPPGALGVTLDNRAVRRLAVASIGARA
jgi:o-succinylbenzoate synthase